MLTICEALKFSLLFRVNRGVEPEAEMAPRNEDMVEVKLIFQSIKNNLMYVENAL